LLSQIDDCRPRRRKNAREQNSAYGLLRPQTHAAQNWPLAQPQSIQPDPLSACYILEQEQS